MDSDHLPIIIKLGASPTRSNHRTPSWIFSKESWPAWNSLLFPRFIEANLTEIMNPVTAYAVFYESMLSVSHNMFRLSSPSPKKTFPTRPPLVEWGMWLITSFKPHCLSCLAWLPSFYSSARILEKGRGKKEKTLYSSQKKRLGFLYLWSQSLQRCQKTMVFHTQHVG